jgi:putative tryptophan/tyrosine transport system substrate-binding protein
MRRREFIVGLGGAAAWPLAARAQPRMPMIGVLDFFASQPTSPFMQALRAGLADSGFIEGTNLFVEYRSAGRNFRLLASLAADLVSRQVAVILARDNLGPIRAAMAATPKIPIIFDYAGDPVNDGLVASLNRPGGNVTGMTSIGSELAGKRLDFLLKMVPQARKIGFISGLPSFPKYEEQTTRMITAGRALGVEIMIVECRDDRDYDAAVAKMIEGGAHAIILGNFVLPNLGKVVSLAAFHKLPAIYPFTSLARAGGLMSYDADTNSMARRIGSHYVARILKGQKPADLPVEGPTKFELLINLNTARALGLTIPETLLATADELIETEPRLGPNLVRTLGWNLVPTITVVSDAGDPRVPLVNDAVAFWNDTLAALGTPFRLGTLTQVLGAIPVEDLQKISPLVTNLPGLPESLKRIDGNIVVALSDREFITFTARRPALNKAVVAIKDYRSFPMSLPNVARNLIAHELGHAIGLPHNDDPTTLMCGRPAPCRPELFAAESAKYFPLREIEKAELGRMYPRNWQASR